VLEENCSSRYIIISKDFFCQVRMPGGNVEAGEQLLACALGYGDPGDLGVK
jgi:hypothetical protein